LICRAITVTAFLIACPLLGDEITPELRAAFGERLAELRTQISSNKADLDVPCAMEQLLYTRWPEESLPEVNRLIQVSVRNFGLQNCGNSSTICSLVRRIPDVCEPYANDVAELMESAEIGEKLGLLSSLRLLGESASGQVELVRKELGHSSPVIQIHAAATLVTIANDAAATRFLLRAMSGKSPPLQWRAVYLLGKSGRNEKAWLEPIRRLAKDNDVAVRTAAASAIWNLTGKPEECLPVLLDVIQRRDQSMAMGFAYPSDMGDSHRIFALMTLSSIGTDAAEAIPRVIQILDETTKVDQPSSAIHKLSWYALSALTELGPEAAKALPQVRLMAQRPGTIFQQLPKKTEELLSKLQAARPE